MKIHTIATTPGILVKKLELVLNEYRELFTVTDVELLKDTIRLLKVVEESQGIRNADDIENETKIVLNVLRFFSESPEISKIVKQL